MDMLNKLYPLPPSIQAGWTAICPPWTVDIQMEFKLWDNISRYEPTILKINSWHYYFRQMH